MTELIAEIGWNHMGDMSLAKKMINEADLAGAAFAKFQTWSVKRLKNGEWDNDGRREIYNAAELSEEMHVKLITHCKDKNIDFMSSAFSLPDAQLLKKLKVNVVKIPSFEVANYDLIKYCDDNFLEVIISTGTATKEEILKLPSLIDNSKTTIMHCVSSYPCEIANANLKRIEFLSTIFQNVGYSDHVTGIDASIYAMKYPLNYIEKHFTLDHELPGRDNKFAILPEELKSLSSHIDANNLAHIDHGINFQSIEGSSRSEYRGRFNN